MVSKVWYCDLFRNAKLTTRDQASNCGRIAAKIARFNSVISEIIGRKFTKFVPDVVELLLFNSLKAASRSANPLSNARAKSKGLCWRRLRTAWNLAGCHSNVTWRPPKKYQDNHLRPYTYLLWKVSNDQSRTFRDIWRDMSIFSVSWQKLSF